MFIRCPNGHVLQVDDAHAGHKALCPLCSTLMQIPAETEIGAASGGEPLPRMNDASIRSLPKETDSFPEEELADFSPEGQRLAERLAAHAEALSRVRLGLSFHLAKVYATIIGTVLVFLAIVVSLGAKAQAGGGPPFGRRARPFDLERLVEDSQLMLALLLAVAVVPPVLGIIGSWLCTRVPKESGASGPIATSLLVDKLHILLALSSPFLSPEIRSWETAVGGMLHLIAFVAFMNFLRNLAIFCGRMELAQQARTLLVWPYLLAGGGVVLLVISAVIAAINPMAVVLLAVVVLGIGFGIFLWLVRYLLLLHQLRAVLQPGQEVKA